MLHPGCDEGNESCLLLEIESHEGNESCQTLQIESHEDSEEPCNISLDGSSPWLLQTGCRPIVSCLRPSFPRGPVDGAIDDEHFP